MVPEAVKEWIESQEPPFTIFVTPSKDIILVYGEGPWEAYRNWKSEMPDLPNQPVLQLIEREGN